MNKFRLPIDPTGEQIRAHLDVMKKAHIDGGPPSIALRKDRLVRTLELLQKHRDAFVDALNADYGNRNRQQTLLADILTPIEELRSSIEHLDEWMEAPRTIAPFPGTIAWVEYQPLGVVGIISPWNFPLALAFGPLASAFSAGNRAILKPSELTPLTSELTGDLIAQYFAPDELTTVIGGPSTGATFSAQPFDHLVFTGSTQVAHHVMRAASDNLVPVTLELGGKSPVVIAPDADLRTAAERVLTVKTFNAGQICLSPDYVLVQADRIDGFVAQAADAISRMYPTMRDNKDYTSMVNVKGFERQRALVDDAQSKGATIINLGPQNEDLSDPEVRKIAPTLIVNPTDAMRAMQEEIFGPVLPVVTYESLADAIAYVNARPRPLALYFFGNTLAEQKQVAAGTTSGALVVNDAMTHVFIDALPFGGVGASGMGHYHGVYGFRALSHTKPVFQQSTTGDSNLPLRAPYHESSDAAITAMIMG